MGQTHCSSENWWLRLSQRVRKAWGDSVHEGRLLILRQIDCLAAEFGIQVSGGTVVEREGKISAGGFSVYAILGASSDRSLYHALTQCRHFYPRALPSGLQDHRSAGDRMAVWPQHPALNFPGCSWLKPMTCSLVRASSRCRSLRMHGFHPAKYTCSTAARHAPTPRRLQSTSVA